ncbi:MAG: hypothetical protein RLZZ399_2693 [Verrucomicrobiota bacterium]
MQTPAPHPPEDPPSVSVGVPTYNGASFLRECLVSVASQKGVRLQILVLDDGSSDACISIAQAVAREYPEAEWIIRTHPSRLGMVGNWNACVEAATHEYFKLIGQDDLLLPGCLQMQASVLANHPEVSIAATGRMLINARGRSLFCVPTAFPKGVISGKSAAIRTMLSGTNRIGDPVAILCRRKMLCEAGPFDAQLHYCPDLEMWLRMLTLGDLYFDPEPAVQYRIHGESAGKSLQHLVSREFLQTIQALSPRFGLPLNRLQRWRIRLISHALGWLRSRLYTLLNISILH